MDHFMQIITVNDDDTAIIRTWMISTEVKEYLEKQAGKPIQEMIIPIEAAIASYEGVADHAVMFDPNELG